MQTFVLNPGKKKSKKAGKRKLARARRKITWKMRRGFAAARRKKSHKKYTGRHQSKLRQLLCGKRKKSEARIKRMRRALCGAPKRASSAPETTVPFFESAEGSYAAPVQLNPSRSRFGYRRSKNPGFMDGIKAAFSPKGILGVMPIVGGMIGANMLRKWVGGQSWTPNMLKSGQYANLAVGIAGAGALAMLAGKLAPKYAGSILIGGVAEALTGLANTVTGSSVLGSCGSCSGMGCVGCGAIAMLAGGPADGGAFAGGNRLFNPYAVDQQVPANTASMSNQEDMMDSFTAEDVF